MLENEPTGAGSAGDSLTGSTTGSTNSDSPAGSSGTDAGAASPTPEPPARPARRRAARRPAGPPAEPPSSASDTPADAVPAAVIAPAPSSEPVGAVPDDKGWPVVPAPAVEAPAVDVPAVDIPAQGAPAEGAPAAQAPAPDVEPAPRRRATRSRRRTAEPTTSADAATGAGIAPAATGSDAAPATDGPADPTPPDVAVEVTAPRARRRRRSAAAETDVTAPAADQGIEAAAAAPATSAAGAGESATDGQDTASAPAGVPVATGPAAEAVDAAPTSRRRRRSSANAGGAAATDSAAADATVTGGAVTGDAAVPDAVVTDATVTGGDVATASDSAASTADAPEAAEPATTRRGRPTTFTPFAGTTAAPAAESEQPTHRTRVRRAPMVTFMAPEPPVVPIRQAETEAVEADEPEDLDETGAEYAEGPETEVTDDAEDTTADDADGDDESDDSRRRRRRGRRGRGRGRGENGADGSENESDDLTADGSTEDEADTSASDEGDEGDDESGAEGSEGADDESGTSRRRRRRRRRGAGDAPEIGTDDPPNTVVRVRQPVAAAPPRSIEDEVQGVKGSTRLEAKRQRRREGRESNRRRPPVLSEAEFLARREAVERVMVVRQIGDRTQIAVLEDDVLVEHYVTKASSTAYAGNVYLGRVQNVLPSMEAAFVDIGKGRNAVLYAGEVNWDAAGMEGRPRKIEVALKSGDSVLVQVTKDPMGHKGARLTSQVSLPGRFLVYVPEGQMTGISRKLPDTERKRLKDILKKIVPENAGVIIRTAAEGASEAELTHDVERLEAQWQAIKEKAAKGGAPVMLNAEPDLVIRVIRDVFNEDFSKLVVSGNEAWPQVEAYVRDVSPDLAERLVHHTAETDVFAAYRIDEQITKALDRKVWLPSGGSLVIDRTEAMTVVDVNTGKFTGQGGNLEETVTRNNLEAAEEIVRQLRLRDIGGIIVIDFIDMVLEANRDLVLRRLTECLGRDRTKHQVAEVTSLGLVQMTRKRVGQGLLEAFSETCEVCRGRGVILHNEPLIGRQSGGNSGGSNSGGSTTGNGGHQHGEAPAAEPKEGRRGRRKRGGGGGGEAAGAVAPPVAAAVAAIHAASARAVSAPADGDDADDTAESLIVDDVAREAAVEGDLAYDVADADIDGEQDADFPSEGSGQAPVDGGEAPAADVSGDRHPSGIGTAHAAAAVAIEDAGVDSAKPADRMVVNGAASVPTIVEPSPGGGALLVSGTTSDAAPAKRPRRTRRAASRPAGPPEGTDTE